MATMKERWKEEIIGRYRSYFGDVEIDIGELTVEIKDHRLRRIMSWDENLQQSLKPFFPNAEPFYTYQAKIQGSATKSYTVEFPLDDMIYLLTIERRNEKIIERIYGKEEGMRTFRVLKEHEELEKEYNIGKEKMKIFKEIWQQLPEIRLRQFF